MKWAAQSPDLNPIKNIWHQVEIALRHKGPFENVDELYDILKPRGMRSNKKKSINSLNLCRKDVP